MNLDAITREHMIAELEDDTQNSRLYISGRLSPAGVQQYPTLLRTAIAAHDDAWLADQLTRQRLLIATEQRRKPSGGYTTAKLPFNAAEVLADGEFNRYYCRGVCARTRAEGRLLVEVYRGQVSANPRPESQALIGRQLDATSVLYELRSAQGVEPALGVPPGPNSGLTLKMVP